MSGISPSSSKVINCADTHTVDLSTSNDPSFPFPVSDIENQARIRDGPYQPQLSNYNKTFLQWQDKVFLPKW